MNALFEPKNAIIQQYKTFPEKNIYINIKREDLLHKEVSGNKLRKLKYNLIEARKSGFDTLLTFGGAYSNHIVATAAAGTLCNFKTIGYIRGDELGMDINKTLSSNPTLALATKHKMQLKFISREAYKSKNDPLFLKEIQEKYPNAYIIPEGGTNELAVKGTSEILSPEDKINYDIIAVAAGTGGTAAGIIESSHDNQLVYVFSALKGDFMKSEIRKYTTRSNFLVIDENVFGGYAKVSSKLIDFMNIRFRESVITTSDSSGIALDPIYTGKMMYRIEQLIENGVIIENSRILAVHTGGLQGIAGFNILRAKKGLTILDYAATI